jgi:hypothetical protein
MNWNPFKPFGRERTEVADILERVLTGSMDCREWDDFIRTYPKTCNWHKYC